MIRDAIIEQQREMENRWTERYIERDASGRTADSGDLIRVITGPRRAGKSVFALHTLRKEVGKVGYVNFDDERLLGVSNYDDILNAVDLVYKQPDILLLDEIQNLEKWELFVNRLQRQRRRLLITGSNALLLSSELATHLTGRYLTIPLLPFNFTEYLRVQGDAFTDSEKKSFLANYAREGGFPEPLLTSVNRPEYLRTLVHATLYKDIVKRHNLRAVQGLEDMAHYLLSNMAKEFSYRSLTTITRCKSTTTVEKYVRYLEESYLLFTLQRFSFKTRKQASYNKRIYAADNATALALGFCHSADTGRFYENLVAIALWRRMLNNELQVWFWKNAQNEEVDFLVRRGTKIIALIQVCSDLTHPKTRLREERALLCAGQELNCRNLLILTDSMDTTQDAEWFGIKGRIRYRPLWRWLLDEAIE